MCSVDSSLDSIRCQEVTVSATEPSGFLHQIEAKPIDSIRVVSEFPDAFPEDLPEQGRGVDEDVSGSFC